MDEKIFDIGIVKTEDELHKVMELRRSVFVQEEGVPEDKEFDGNDFVGNDFVGAIHFL